MKNLVPHYFYSKQNTILLVVCVAIFAELFILIFSPFQSRTWVKSDWEFLGWTTLVVLVCMAVIAVSRTIMYHYAKHSEITYLGYGTWIFIELAVMSTIYTLVPSLLLPEFMQEFSLSIFPLYREVILATGFILLIPYVIMALVFELRDKNEQLQRLTNKDAAPIVEDQPDMYNFYDEKGELKLSVKPEMVYYLEAADNYVQIHYMNAGKMQNLMLRNTLKNIEWRFRGKELVRCHRSFIVNFSKVQMMRKAEGDVMLDFGDERLPNVPVSKAYSENVMGRFKMD